MRNTWIILEIAFNLPDVKVNLIWIQERECHFDVRARVLYYFHLTTIKRGRGGDGEGISSKCVVDYMDEPLWAFNMDEKLTWATVTSTMITHITIRLWVYHERQVWMTMGWVQSYSLYSPWGWISTVRDPLNRGEKKFLCQDSNPLND